MNVMTFNLRADFASDGKNAWSFRKENVAKIIKKHNPSIIGTQEGLDYMLEDVLKELSNFSLIGSGREENGGGEHSAILYKNSELECLENGQFWLSENPDVPGSKSWGTACTRICTWGRFQSVTQPENEFFFYNTHLDHMSEEARINGIQLIIDHIQNHVKYDVPLFLTGDMNVTPEEEVIQFLNQNKDLVSVYRKMNGPVGVTYHDFEGGIEGDPIDYIYVSKELQIQQVIVDRTAFEGIFPSDHYPVVVSIKYEKNKTLDVM